MQMNKAYEKKTSSIIDAKLVILFIWVKWMRFESMGKDFQRITDKAVHHTLYNVALSQSPQSIRGLTSILVDKTEP